MQKIQFKIDLFPWQSDCVKFVGKNKGKLNCVVSKRQCGKTLIMQLLMLQHALERKNAMVYFMSVTYKNCSKVFKEIIKSIENKPWVTHIDKQKLIIEFVNGSFISFISAEQSVESLQGNTATLLLVDEACYIDEDAWSAVLPYVNVTRGTVVVCSTPRYVEDWFYKLVCDGNDPKNTAIHTFDMTKYDTSAMISAGMLEYYRKSLPKNKFMNYFLGKWVEGSGSVFDGYHRCVGKITPEMKKKPVKIGCDWGSGSEQDYTVLTAVTEQNEVVGIWRDNTLKSTDLIKAAVDWCTQFNVVGLRSESNSIGSTLSDLLKKEIKKRGLMNWHVNIVPTTNKSKLNQVEYLQVLFQNGTIILPDDETLLHELGIYERKVSSNGTVTFNAPTKTSNGEPAHDDCVLSLMFAVWAWKKGTKTTFG